jgi:alpha-glucosidase
MQLFQRLILLLIFFNVFALCAQSTASQQVKRFSITGPWLNEEREIWLYLPKDYENSERHFPVLYMFDGQNVFDEATSYAGEWKVDEFLDDINGQHIVVAIAHGNENRIKELTPFKNKDYGGGEGQQFLDFIITKLKPYIDKTYRTLPDEKHTSIAGSSLGGLMAFYAVLKHPDVFSRALVLSPAFWINPEVTDMIIEKNIPDTSRFYILLGTEEGDVMSLAYKQAQEQLNLKNLDGHQLFMDLAQGGQHNEASWEQQFRWGYQWLFE